MIKSRKLLPNEVMVDVSGKSKDNVLKEVIKIIDNFKPLKKYAYKLDNKNHYLSWVQSRNLV
ncbi:MAG: hypothetical protein UIC65_01595 [Alphaproteobacteria bacterium]|nr:hypothetical protein [Alphaproteobacteria bacterium]